MAVPGPIWFTDSYGDLMRHVVTYTTFDSTSTDVRYCLAQLSSAGTPVAHAPHTLIVLLGQAYLYATESGMSVHGLTPSDSSRRSRRSARSAAPDKGPRVTQRLAAVENALEEIKTELALHFKRSAAIQAQLDHLAGKMSER